MVTWTWMVAGAAVADLGANRQLPSSLASCCRRPGRRRLLARLEVLLERGRLGDGLALVAVVDEGGRVAGVGHAAGAELGLAVLAGVVDDGAGGLASGHRLEGRDRGGEGKDGAGELHFD